MQTHLLDHQATPTNATKQADPTRHDDSQSTKSAKASVPTKRLTQMIPPTTAETSEEILMQLQETIDPEPLNPTEFTCFFDPSKPSAGKSNLPQSDSNQKLNTGAIFPRLLALGSLHSSLYGSLPRPEWLSGQPSPLSDLQTPSQQLQRVVFGLAQSEPSSELSEQVQTPRSLVNMRC